MQNTKRSLIVMGALLLVLTGCSSVTDTLKSWGSSEDDTTSWEDTGEMSATDTLNRYTDLINDAQDQVSYLDDSTQYADYDLNNYDEAYGVSFSCSFDLYDREALYTDTMNPTGLEDAEAEELKAQATIVFATLDQLDTLCKDLHKYVAAQEFKTDLEKGKGLVASIYTAIDTYYAAHDVILEKTDALYDKYNTWTVDPSDPISVSIDNMNKDLDQAELILDLVEDAYVNENYTRGAELQGLYDTLTAQVATHTGAYMPAVDSYYSYNLETFYDDLELNFLPNAMVAQKAITAANADDLYTAYSNVLDYYNYMIDDYNYFLDATGY